MKTTILFSLIIFLYSFGLAQNNAPEVTNVTFSQRIDGTFIVDVYYDLNDADGDTMTVNMRVSEDAGTTWEFACQNITGDVGDSILAGTGKHIIWDFGIEHPSTSGNNFQIKIIADDWFLITGTVTDIDGNVYQTVRIGDQWWMAENLKVTHYRNGDVIPNVTDNSEWSGLSTGAYASYDNADSNIATYGLLYNWYAVDDSRNIAPAGWHVPTDEEWKELEMYLGMSQSESDDNSWRGTNEGSKLKATSGWYSGGNGTNESGFSAIPGGYRYYYDGAFYSVGIFGLWWSSTESGSHAWYRALGYGRSDVYRSNYNKLYGFSVRLVMY
jgi:uncharacterized protein (TIGR02145 family)